jgi:hypothetical protein
MHPDNEENKERPQIYFIYLERLQIQIFQTGLACIKSFVEQAPNNAHLYKLQTALLAL